MANFDLPKITNILSEGNPVRVLLQFQTADRHVGVAGHTDLEYARLVSIVQILLHALCVPQRLCVFSFCLRELATFEKSTTLVLQSRCLVDTGVDVAQLLLLFVEEFGGG